MLSKLLAHLWGLLLCELLTCMPPGLSENQLNDCLPWGEGLQFSEETTLGSKSLGMELEDTGKLKARRAWVGGSTKFFPQCFEEKRHEGALQFSQ